MRTINVLFPAALILAGLSACRGDRPDVVLERAAETSQRLARAEWRYDREQRAPERGEREPVMVDRCQLDVPGEDAPLDVACGLFFIALEPDADSTWVEQLVRALGGEVVERRTLPSWAIRSSGPIPYVLVSVPIGEEPVAIRRAAASEGVRFVDVRRMPRRRP